jgi:ribose transport system substrate-binding protein
MMRTNPSSAGGEDTFDPRHDHDGVPVRRGGERMIQKGSIRAKALGGLAVVAIVAAACSSSGASTAPSAAAGPYHIGFANGGGVGNGWRESSICSVKAQAVASGNVDKVTVINHDTDAAGQLTDIRDLIAADVDAIIINPNDPDALNPAIDEAIAAGIPVIAVDAFVTADGAYNLSNDQVEYAYLGAKALFEQMGKKGDVVYMRGIAGHPADTDRDTGFKKALAEYPDIKVAKEVVTKWDPATAVSQINDIMSSGVNFDGVWTSGVDSSIVEAMKTAGHPLVPLVGADNAGFVTQLLNEPNFTGAAVTNPSAVTGAGVVLALKLLAGDKPAETTVHVTPELWDNTTEDGKAALAAAQNPNLPELWPLGLTVKDWTTYSVDDLIACKGPGE